MNSLYNIFCIISFVSWTEKETGITNSELNTFALLTSMSHLSTLINNVAANISQMIYRTLLGKRMQRQSRVVCGVYVRTRLQFHLTKTAQKRI